MPMEPKYVGFDWAMKRLLRDKANHAVIEGLLSSLIGRDFHIVRFLESEGNQESEQDKFNRVDILAESDDGSLTIVEIQNSHQLDYFHRMLYGVSKTITEYIGLGDAYSKIRKVYSVNIVYFELGQGGDYVYHGTTDFVSLHEPYDHLRLTRRQSEAFFGAGGEDHMAGDLFPEYYILRVNDFDKVAVTPLDEWVKFLKDGYISDKSQTPGLVEARRCMLFSSMNASDRRSFLAHMEALRMQRSVLETSRGDGLREGLRKGLEIGRKEGMAEGMAEGASRASASIARKLLAMGMAPASVAQATGLSEAEVEALAAKG